VREGRLRASDGGFTLVELAVALAVIGVLLGIAVPTYLGTRAGAEDQAAKSAAMAGLKAHRALSDGDHAAPIEALQAAEPNLDVAPLGDDGQVPRVLGRVYVRVDSDEVTLVARSGTGHCFWTRDATTSVRYAENDCTGWPDFTTSW
jgi:type IV pilus assembly protein PilA